MLIFFNRTLPYAIPALMISALAGCSSTPLNSSIDYRSAGNSVERVSNTLDVPPDLSQLPIENIFSVSGAGGDLANPDSPVTVTANAYKIQHPDHQNQPSKVVQSLPDKVVSPNTLGDIKVMRDGNVRWLQVAQSPQSLWTKLEDFWRSQGFSLPIDSPQIGIMETNWLENRANIPNDFIRRALGTLFSGMYDTGLRDKYRTRIERVAGGVTEIYVTQRGMVEELTGNDKSSSIWTERKPDPGLEATMLARLMIYLGTEKEKAESAVNFPEMAQSNVKEIKKGDVTFLELAEPIDSAWRKVGVVLDRSNFTVEDSDRSKGRYFVQYKKPNSSNSTDGNFLTKLFSFSKDNPEDRFQVHLTNVGDMTQISVLDVDGKPDTSDMARKILSVLKGQLK